MATSGHLWMYQKYSVLTTDRRSQGDTRPTRHENTTTCTSYHFKCIHSTLIWEANITKLPSIYLWDQQRRFNGIIYQAWEAIYSAKSEYIMKWAHFRAPLCGRPQQVRTTRPYILWIQSLLRSRSKNTDIFARSKMSISAVMHRENDAPNDWTSLTVNQRTLQVYLSHSVCSTAALQLTPEPRTPNERFSLEHSEHC